MDNPRWQRLACVGVAASAAIFLTGSAWQVIGVLAPVLGLFGILAGGQIAGFWGARSLVLPRWLRLWHVSTTSVRAGIVHSISTGERCRRLSLKSDAACQPNDRRTLQQPDLVLVV